MPHLAGVALVFGLALLAPPSTAAQSLQEVVAGVEAAYARIADLKADFTQQAFNKSLGQTIKDEGTVFLKRPGKMRWEYRAPSPQQIVSDGQ